MLRSVFSYAVWMGLVIGPAFTGAQGIAASESRDILWDASLVHEEIPQGEPLVLQLRARTTADDIFSYSIESFGGENCSSIDIHLMDQSGDVLNGAEYLVGIKDDRVNSTGAQVNFRTLVIPQIWDDIRIDEALHAISQKPDDPRRSMIGSYYVNQRIVLNRWLSTNRPPGHYTVRVVICMCMEGSPFTRDLDFVISNENPILSAAHAKDLFNVVSRLEQPEEPEMEGYVGTLTWSRDFTGYYWAIDMLSLADGDAFIRAQVDCLTMQYTYALSAWNLETMLLGVQCIERKGPERGLLEMIDLVEKLNSLANTNTEEDSFPMLNLGRQILRDWQSWASPNEYRRIQALLGD